jgi:hypothetical protein
MKPAIIAACIVGLTACTGTTTTSTPTEAPATTPATTAPIPMPSIPQTQTAEDFFIEFIYEEFPYPIYVPDRTLLETGYAVCDAFDAGVPAQLIVAELLAATDGDENATLLLTITTGAATGILCPEYVDAWDTNRG